MKNINILNIYELNSFDNRTKIFIKKYLVLHSLILKLSML